MGADAVFKHHLFDWIMIASFVIIISGYVPGTIVLFTKLIAHENLLQAYVVACTSMTLIAVALVIIAIDIVFLLVKPSTSTYPLLATSSRASF